jgi:hypothetical protein
VETRGSGDPGPFFVGSDETGPKTRCANQIDCSQDVVGEYAEGGFGFDSIETSGEVAPACVSDRTVVARRMIDRGFALDYDYALQTLNDVPYNKWRDYDPEDTIRFFSLRLREAGMIKSAPNKIIAQGTDWRFFNELKRELKG